MDAAYANDGILDFDLPASDLATESQQTEPAGATDSAYGPGQGDATVLAWARAM